MLHFQISFVIFALRLRSPFRMSRLVCGAHLRLLAPWATRLLSQWMLHWWQVNSSTAREPFPATIYKSRARGWTHCKYFLSSLWCDPTGNRTQATSFGSACSTDA